MYFQKVLKGIPDVSRQKAQRIIHHEGIISNFRRVMRRIDPKMINQGMTVDNVLHHLNDYDTPLPRKHPYAGHPGVATYGDVTPFISTTAGTIERDASALANWKSRRIQWSAGMGRSQQRFVPNARPHHHKSQLHATRRILERPGIHRSMSDYSSYLDLERNIFERQSVVYRGYANALFKLEGNYPKIFWNVVN
jgi:hypothetical protein